jgi:serine/threonine protein kinase
MGVVYKARSRQPGEVVALKCVLSATHSSLYRFKQEFRALADVVYPNLVTLHELRADGPTLYFTMEFIEGTDLSNYVMVTPQGRVIILDFGVAAELDRQGRHHDASGTIY